MDKILQKNIRVLLVYANSMMDNLIPLNISYLTACLKDRGIQVRLFDTTFYRSAEKSSDEARVEMLQVKPFDLLQYGIRYKETDVFDDFRKCVEDFCPELIGFSVVEPTFCLAERLLNAIEDLKEGKNVIFGGIFSIFAYEKILANPLVDMVCFGEGEKAIVEVCEYLAGTRDCADIRNVAVKQPNRTVFNKKAPLVNLNTLPYLDFSLFEKERFYKPMGGKVLRMVPVEFARGCPYQCTYCASPALAEVSKDVGRWFRQKDIKRIISEIDFYLKQYQVEYFYFISESFLSMGKKEFQSFIDYYKSIRVPFWFNTRIETITHDKLKQLEQINCNRISVGLESGSYNVRKTLLKRNYSNDYFIEKFKILGNYNISVSVNNIIGFPDETRDEIFETIDLNRKIRAESFGAYIFQPYQGTYLRDYCVKKGYMPGNYIAGDAHVGSGLKTSGASDEEIRGLQRVFTLYVKLPRSYYNDIKIAERFDKKGNETFRRLGKLYNEKYT